MAEDKLRQIIDAIFDTHLDNIIDCESCERQFHCIADLVAQGADAAVLLPAVEEHLRCCRDCREEFNCLISILQADIAEREAAASGSVSQEQSNLPTTNKE